MGDDLVFFQVIINNKTKGNNYLSHNINGFIWDSTLTLFQSALTKLAKEIFCWSRINKVLDWIGSCDRCMSRKTGTNIRSPLVNTESSEGLQLKKVVCLGSLGLEKSKGGFQPLSIITHVQSI